MSTHIRFLSALLLFSLSLVGDAYKIDDTCQGQDLQRVQQAAAEAVNMYEYANFRITQDNPRLDFGAGRVFDQLLGPNARDSLLQVVSSAPNRIGPDRGTITSTQMSQLDWQEEDQVIIGCDIAGHILQDAAGHWTDRRYRRMPLNTDGPFCEDPDSAFVLATNAGPGAPRYHLYLCPAAYPDAAMALPNTRIHDRWRQLRWDNTAYNQLYYYISVVLVHELNHVIDDAIVDAGEPGYSFDGIQTLTPQVKSKNSQSFTFAIAALWLRHNTMGSQGQRFGKISRKFPRNNRPAPGPHYDPTP